MGAFRLLYTRTRQGRDVLQLRCCRFAPSQSLAALALSALLPSALNAQARACASLHFEGEVAAGNNFSRNIDASHAFLLESTAAGWIIRVLPLGPLARTRAPHDFAELATPPYRSPNPLVISTDFAFRAQDAIAWNPREFHYFATQEQMSIATRAFDATMREPNRPSAGAALFPLLGQACEASLQILDARIAGGTADQTAAAATVASHFFANGAHAGAECATIASRENFVDAVPRALHKIDRCDQRMNNSVGVCAVSCGAHLLV